jgi:hypothetical protein
MQGRGKMLVHDLCVCVCGGEGGGGGTYNWEILTETRGATVPNNTM